LFLLAWEERSVTASLHGRVLPVIRIEEAAGLPFLAMRMVPRSLRHGHLLPGPFPPAVTTSA
jgi:hypothetical protein